MTVKLTISPGGLPLSSTTTNPEGQVIVGGVTSTQPHLAR
jgi:hypothetical protein